MFLNVVKYVFIQTLIFASVVNATVPNICRFSGSSAGLVVSFKGSVQPQDHYGILNWTNGSWQISDGQGCNSNDGAFVGI